MVAVLFRTMDALRMYDLPAILTGGNAAPPRRCRSWWSTRCGQGFNSASALSTITFLMIFAVAFVLVKFLGANAVRTQEDQRKGGAGDDHRTPELDRPAAVRRNRPAARVQLRIYIGVAIILVWGLAPVLLDGR